MSKEYHKLWAFTDGELLETIRQITDKGYELVSIVPSLGWSNNAHLIIFTK